MGDSGASGDSAEPLTRRALFVLHQDWVDSTDFVYQDEDKAARLKGVLKAVAESWPGHAGKDTGNGDAVQICFSDAEQAVHCARTLRGIVADDTWRISGLPELRARTILHAGHFLPDEGNFGFDQILPVRMDKAIGAGEIWMTTPFKEMLPKAARVQFYGEYIGRFEFGEPLGHADCYRLVTDRSRATPSGHRDPVRIALDMATELAGSDHELDRLAGVRALGGLDDQRAIDQLLKLAECGDHTNDRISAQAILSLPPRQGSITPVIGKIAKCRRCQLINRRLAVQYLGNAADPSALDELRPLVDSQFKDRTVPEALRVAVLVAMRHFDGSKVADAVRYVLENDPTKPTLLVAACVASTGTRLDSTTMAKVIDLAIQTSAGEEKEGQALDVRLAAMEALQQQSPTQSLVMQMRGLVTGYDRESKKLVRSEQPLEIRRHALHLLSRFVTEDTIGVVSRCARAIDDPLRREAAELLPTMTQMPPLAVLEARPRSGGVLAAKIREATLGEDDIG